MEANRQAVKLGVYAIIFTDLINSIQKKPGL